MQAIRIRSAMRTCAELQQHLVSIIVFKEIANLVFWNFKRGSSAMTWREHVQSLRTLQ